MKVNLNDPTVKAAIEAEVQRQLAVKELDGEVTLFDRLDQLKPGGPGLEPLQLAAVKSRLEQEADGGLSLLHRYLDQRYLHDEQTDFGREDAEAYLAGAQEQLGVNGDVLATDTAPAAQQAENVAGVAGAIPDRFPGGDQ